MRIETTSLVEARISTKPDLTRKVSREDEFRIPAIDYLYFYAPQPVTRDNLVREVYKTKHPETYSKSLISANIMNLRTYLSEYCPGIAVYAIRPLDMYVLLPKLDENVPYWLLPYDENSCSIGSMGAHFGILTNTVSLSSSKAEPDTLHPLVYPKERALLSIINDTAITKLIPYASLEEAIAKLSYVNPKNPRGLVSTYMSKINTLFESYSIPFQLQSFHNQGYRLYPKGR